jgi:AcrR family transcriptional regulator
MESVPPVGSLAEQLRAKRSEMMLVELEAAALRLFEARGVGDVTVDDIASAAGVSVRTFYRYFPAKEDVFQLRIDQRSAALAVALAERPLDEPPLVSLRHALAEVVATEDPTLVRQWCAVIADSPTVLKGVLGGIQLKSHRVMAEFFAERLGLAPDATATVALAAAAGGVIQAAQTQWMFLGGDLAARISEGIAVLESGIGGR